MLALRKILENLSYENDRVNRESQRHGIQETRTLTEEEPVGVNPWGFGKENARMTALRHKERAAKVD